MSEQNVKPIPPWAVGLFLAYFAVLLPVCAYGLWRLVDGGASPVVGEGAAKLALTEGELILAVVLAGALGSYVHAANSFVTYVGNRRFVTSWVPWYLLRPFMGVAVAVVVYVAIRSGVLVMSGGTPNVDPYAVMTVAALAGMFSKQASDKLAEVFDTLFRSRGDEERADKLHPAAPRIASIVPDKIEAGAAGAKVKLIGEGFTDQSVVQVGGRERRPVSQTPKEIVIELDAADVAQVARHPVLVVNPAPSGKSNELTLEITVKVPGVVGGGEPKPEPVVPGQDENGGDS